MRRLFILRPEPGASATVERARALGLDAEPMPLFKVEPLEWQAPEAGSFDALLLTSANAVRHGGEKLCDYRGLKVLAVGEATASAAREAGFDIKATGESGVERLLYSFESDLKLLHLAGEDRVDADTQQEIIAVPVYRAAELPEPQGFARIAGQAVAVHSPRAARRLAELAGQAAIDRGEVRVAAISAAAASAAGNGWERCEAAEKPDDGALLALAARLCDKPEPK